MTTKIPIELSSTPGIVDSSNTTALTLDASQNATFAGTVTGSRKLVLNASGTNDTHIEIGANTASNHYAFIDLVGDATYTDYGLRIIRNNGGANTSSFIYHRGTGNFNIETQDSASLKLRTAGADALTIDTSQRVGIGTTSPNQLLHLDNSASSSDSASIRIISGTAGLARIMLGDTGYGSRGRFVYDNSDDSLQLWGAASTTSAERMRISSSGNVMIGTTTESGLLNVNGSLNYGGQLRVNSASHDGSESAPHLCVGYDNDTGFFRPASNTIGITTTGSERMRIGSSGKVGIGTQSPTDDLHVSGSARFNSIVPSYTDTNGTASSTNYFKLGTITLHSSQGAVITVMGTISYSAGSNISGETKIYLRGNNSVSTLTGHFFGTTLGNATVQAVRWKNTGSNNVFEIWIKYGSSFAGLEHYVDTDGTWTSNVSDTGSTSAPSGSTALTSIFAVTTAGTVRMRIDSSGSVGIGTTSFSNGRLDVRSDVANTTEVIGVKNDNSGSYNVMMKFFRQSSAVGRIDWDNTGSSMGFVNLSDERLKTVTGIAKGLSFINRLEPKTYNFKDNDWETEGLIAQEVKAAMEAEEIVVRGIREPETEDDYYGLDYGTFVPNLIQAIKELSAKNDALEARIKELEG